MSMRAERRDQVRMQSSQPADADTGQSSDPGDITQNPDAMECIDKLKSMGYTADDVAQAMGDDTQQADQGAAATSAAPMQLPGMQ